MSATALRDTLHIIKHAMQKFILPRMLEHLTQMPRSARENLPVRQGEKIFRYGQSAYDVFAEGAEGA